MSVEDKTFLYFYGSGTPCVFKSGPEWPVSKGPQAQGIECEACLDQSGVREGRLSDYCSRKSCKIFLAYSKEARCEVLQPADVKLLGRMPRCDTVSHSPPPGYDFLHL